MASNNAVATEVSTAVTKLNDHLAAALNDGAGADAAANNNTTTIITLAGENTGATMEAADVEDLVVVGNEDHEDQENQQEEEDVVISAYTNRNYQAVNNSVLVSGSCAVNDPGVHVVVVEHVDEIRDYDDDDDLDAHEF